MRYRYISRKYIESQNGSYMSNRICNMKYRWYSIVFWVLIQQFKLFFSAYFFTVSLTQCFERFAISTPITSLGPWFLVFFICLLQEGYDDYKRNLRDKIINNQLYITYKNGMFYKKKSSDINVGDLIVVNKNERVPADMVVLKTADVSGEIFIRTDQLDGETDWKLRQAVCTLQKYDFKDIENVCILAEEPNKDIYSFSGSICINEFDVNTLKSVDREHPAPPSFFSKLLKKHETQDDIVQIPSSNKINWLYNEYTRPQYSEDTSIVRSASYGVSGSIEGSNGSSEGHSEGSLNVTRYGSSEGRSLGHSEEISLGHSEEISLGHSEGSSEEHSDGSGGNSDRQNPSDTDKALDTTNNKIEGLSLDNMLWMNTVVATSATLGCVVYTGNETKAMINTSKPRNKMGVFDQELDTYSKYLGALSGSVAFFFTYMRGYNSSFMVTYLKFLFLFSSVIPISLRVTVDMARYVYSYNISNDKKIPNTIVRNSSLPEELGRVSYFLTDKTGTLTKNEMEMKKIHLGTICYTQDLNEEIFKSLAKISSNREKGINVFTRSKKDINSRLYELVECLCVCHNVTPVLEGNKVSYQASSPDEVAIVKWTESVGMKLYKRDRDSMVILDPLNDEQVYEILYIFPFTSETKRMGIIVRHKDQLSFFMKGADAVMNKIIQQTDYVDEETENMARDGLRTLVISKKVLSNEELRQFTTAYENARGSLTNRNDKIAKAMGLIECNMTVLGITGVEDTLQDNVRITLENLKNGGMKIWMLTGDKIETAISIAISSRIFDRSMEYKVLCNMKDKFCIQEAFLEIQKNNMDSIVVDGISLELIMDTCFDEFISLALSLKAVIGCRFSPTQKALVARALKTKSNKIVCCIGDGGNDVSMITEANVGIGIVGKEGNQASLSADYSIEKFCYVTDLFYWHGRNSYKNSSIIANLVIHRGTVLSVINGLFCALVDFIPINIYKGIIMVAYISCYTFFPIFSTVFSHDVSRSVTEKFPELYKELVDVPLLSIQEFAAYNFMSLTQGTIILFGMVIRFKKELFSMATLTFSSLIVNEIFMVFLSNSRISKYMVMSCCVSVLLYLLSFFILGDILYIDSSFYDFITRVLIVNFIAIIPKLLQILFSIYKPSMSSKLEYEV